MRRFPIAIVLTAILVMISDKSKPTNPARPAPPTPGGGETFAQLTDKFMKESLALSPVAASQAGYHRHGNRELDAELDDLSPDAFRRQSDFYRQWRERFRKEMPQASLDAEAAADWQLIDDQIGYNLLELDEIQNYRHNPTGYVELIGNALFLPLTQGYASHETRVGHVLARMEQIPRALAQARQDLVNSDPIFISTAVEENGGNVSLIEGIVKQEAQGSPALRERCEKVTPAAVSALKEFSRWLENDLAKRATTRTWRLGKDLYAKKFRLVMETPDTPEEVLAGAEQDLARMRAEMLTLALPMHQQMYPGHGDHRDLAGRERENKVIGEVLDKIAEDHPKRDQLMEAITGDLENIKQFIREKRIVSLSTRENLKVIPTPVFMRGVYSVAGFHPAPPLEPTAEAEYWVTPIDPQVTDQKAESKLREYNHWVLKWLTLHEALPGHYVQFEHANDIQPPTRRLLRALFGNGSYVEGWAEYIADVMMDAGFTGNDPRFRLSRDKLKLRLVTNAILDVGMQTLGMTDAQAMDLMMGQAFQTQAEAEGKLRRAKLTSTQLPTYYVGLRGWWELRNRFEAAKGGGFDMIQFHDAALDEGPLPLPMVEKILWSHMK